jgi:hypothetical protein
MPAFDPQCLDTKKNGRQRTMQEARERCLQEEEDDDDDEDEGDDEEEET